MHVGLMTAKTRDWRGLGLLALAFLGLTLLRPRAGGGIFTVTLSASPAVGTVGEPLLLTYSVANNTDQVQDATVEFRIRPPGGSETILVRGTVIIPARSAAAPYTTTVIPNAAGTLVMTAVVNGVVSTKNVTISGAGASVPEIRSLQVEMAQITKLPGDLMGLRSIAFDYKGPAREAAGGNSLHIGWGLIRAGFSVSFNNGDNLIGRPGRDSNVFWNWHLFGVGASPDFRSVTTGDLGAPGVATFTAPAPDFDYRLNTDTIAFGRFNVGTVDVWVWVVDGEKVKTDRAAGATIEEAVTKEANFVGGSSIITVADPFSLQPATPTIRSLGVTFAQRQERLKMRLRR